MSQVLNSNLETLLDSDSLSLSSCLPSRYDASTQKSASPFCASSNAESLYTPPIQCDLIIAESTIPNAGLGIFSTVQRRKGEKVGNGDKAIPLVDIYWHNDPGFYYPMADYIWNGNVMGMTEEVEKDDIDAYWPGLDCMINCNLALINVEKAIPKYDEAGFHRSTHPGAGAISYYNNGTTEVIRDVPAGGELFKHYSDHWYAQHHTDR